jgi:Met-zincin
MRLLHSCAVGLLVATLSSVLKAVAVPTATLHQAELGQRFLLQVSYEQRSVGFNTSRSRIVIFERDGAVLHMLDVSDTRGSDFTRVLASIPIRRETRGTLDLDLNEGFDTVYREEDRTGEDYYGRIDRRDVRAFRLFERKPVSMSRHDATLVFDQEARTEDGHRIVVHYYLSPYRPHPDFRPFEMKNLRRFGFYETYPQWRSDDWVLYAMKFDVHQPIVFALSSAIPERYRSALRDGVLYWNHAFGTSVLRVIDAPPDVRAPSPDYNVIQWVTSGAVASTSYIQSDPWTGQILHAHIFVRPETMADGDLEQQNDHLRYIAAHEVGHALGLRHNFAAGDATTVMDYFKLPQILQIGRNIRAGAPALPFDTAIVQHVYLGAPLELATLPPFCTDSQPGCVPFRSTPTESDAMRGGASADVR